MRDKGKTEMFSNEVERILKEAGIVLSKEEREKLLRETLYTSIEELIRTQYTEHDDETYGSSLISDLKEEVDFAIHTGNYEKLHELLAVHEDETLDVLHKKTENRVIDLGTPEGKEIWKSVIDFYREKGEGEKIEPIYSKLAENSRTKFQIALDNFIHETVFAIHTGVTLDPQAGLRLADKILSRVNKRRKRTLRKEFG